MKYTSAEIAKILRKLNDDYNMLLSKENESKSFVAAMGEDIDSVRPEYDYVKTAEELCRNENKIRKIKHALNVFNTTQIVPGFDMTIDEILVYIPQLSKRKEKLAGMKSQLPKKRDYSYGRTNNIIDYKYINYDLKDVEADYDEVCKLLSDAQLALDKMNNSLCIEIELD